MATDRDSCAEVGRGRSSFGKKKKKQRPEFYNEQGTDCETRKTVAADKSTVKDERHAVGGEGGSGANTEVVRQVSRRQHKIEP